MEEVLFESIASLLRWLGANTEVARPLASFLAIFSYVLSPFLALWAFWANKRTHARLRSESSRYAYAKAKAISAQDDALRRKEQVREEQAKILLRERKIRELEEDLRRITDGNQELWGLRPNRPFPEYRDWYLRRKGAPILTVGHLKGGVGKTTLAANLAAYVSTTLKKPVLLLDLDYQGSLSSGLMLAAEQFDVESHIDKLFEGHADLATLERAKVHLTPALDRGWLVPASYPFAATESRLLMQWLLKEQPEVDVRYRLAHLLLRPEIRENYALIILDMPPRMTMGSVNAMIASHHFLVPTILDKLSVEAISLFLSQLKAVKGELDLEIDLAGIVATLTRQNQLNDREGAAWEMVGEAMKVWGEKEYRIKKNLPVKSSIAGVAGEGVAYNLTGVDGKDIRTYFDPIFEEILTRIGVIEID